MTSASEQPTTSVFASDDAGEGTGAAPNLGARAGSGPTTAQEYQADFQAALTLADHNRPRSWQTSEGVLGASDAGGCPQKAVYTVRRTPPSDVVKKGKARIGTALHAAFLVEVQQTFPERIIEPSLTVTLPSGAQLPLHPDEIDPSEPSVTDYKFVSDLAYTKRVGVSEQQHMQRNLQALAAVQAGIVPEQNLIVRNLFVSMTDSDDTWVQQEPFSMDWVHKADDWFSTVRYAIEHDEDAQRDAPLYVCQSYCPFFSICKPPLLDAMGELQSPALREAVVVGREAREQRKHFEQLEKQAKELLNGVSGRVGNLQHVSTWVNAKNGFWKSDYRELT